MIGDLITLRAFESEDVEAAVEVLSAPALWGCRGIDADRHGPMSRAQLGSTIGKWAEPEHGEVFAIDRAGEYAGHVQVDWWWDARCPSLKMVVAPWFRRQGLGREAASLVIDHLFEDTPAKMIHVWVADWNEAGLAFVRSLGFSPTGRMRRTGIRDGSFHDSIPWDLLKGEWRSGNGA